MSDVLTELEVERLLVAAFADARETVVEHPDLFARVERSIDEARARRRFRVELASGVAAFIVTNGGLALALSDFEDGRILMPWWVVELITNIVLIAIAIALGPFIKRFGRAYAADVFRANPRTGKSYLVLTDVAYYLIFTAFILFTVRFEEHPAWFTRSAQYEHEVARIAGILLIMGVLHAANVVALPVIGNLLQGERKGIGQAGAPPLAPGTWLIRVEPAPSTDVSDPEL